MMPASAPPSGPTFLRRPEVRGALLVGALALLLALLRAHRATWPTDLDQWYFAGRAMLQGRSPYDAVGPTREFQWNWRLNYPLSTVIFTLPLTLLSVPVARIVFSVLGGGVLGYALGKDAFRRVGAVLSAAFLIAVFRNQWSPFYTAAWFVPLAALVLAAKPNMAVAFVAGVRSWRQFRWIVGIGLAIGVASLIARPAWPLEWLMSLREMPRVVSPIMRPFGFLYALALLKWRRPEARLFLALVCVPQTPSLYDLLPLFIVTRSTREVLVLSLLTHVLFFTIAALGPFVDFNAYAHRLGELSIVVYLPVLYMLLRRPNALEDQAVAATASTPTGFPAGLRARIEAAARLDVLLLLANVVAAILFVWFTTTTNGG